MRYWLSLRQEPNVLRMKALGAEVRPVTPARRTLKDAMNEALRDWVTNVARHVLLHRHRGGPASLSDDGARLPVGDRPRGARADHGAEGRLPDSLIACIGGGSNAIGLFHPFLDDRERRDLRRRSRRPRARQAARGLDLPAAAPACCTATAPICCMDDDGQIQRGAFDLRRPRLSRHRARARLAARHRPGEFPLRHRQRGARRLPAAAAGWRASSRRWSRRTRWPRSPISRRSCRRTT